MRFINGDYIVCVKCREWFPHKGGLPELCAVCAGSGEPDERIYPTLIQYEPQEPLAEASE